MRERHAERAEIFTFDRCAFDVNVFACFAHLSVLVSVLVLNFPMIQKILLKGKLTNNRNEIMNNVPSWVHLRCVSIYVSLFVLCMSLCTTNSSLEMNHFSKGNK